MATKKVTDEELRQKEQELAELALAELRRRGITDAEIHAFTAKGRKKMKPRG
jgi:hypothetical protein